MGKVNCLTNERTVVHVFTANAIINFSEILLKRVSFLAKSQNITDLHEIYITFCFKEIEHVYATC